MMKRGTTDTVQNVISLISSQVQYITRMVMMNTITPVITAVIQ